jgi:hypothetical protein
MAKDKTTSSLLSRATAAKSSTDHSLSTAARPNMASRSRDTAARLNTAKHNLSRDMARLNMELKVLRLKAASTSKFSLPRNM